MTYIWDSNIVIYYLNRRLNSVAKNFIDAIPENSQPTISVITEIEILGWPNISQEEKQKVNKFLGYCQIIQLSNDVKLKTIELKQQRRIKLPDAVIAAVAICQNATLLSRNDKDFVGIPGLKFVNPFTGE